MDALTADTGGVVFANECNGSQSQRWSYDPEYGVFMNGLGNTLDLGDMPIPGSGLLTTRRVGYNILDDTGVDSPSEARIVGPQSYASARIQDARKFKATRPEDAALAGIADLDPSLPSPRSAAVPANVLDPENLSYQWGGQVLPAWIGIIGRITSTCGFCPQPIVRTPTSPSTATPSTVTPGSTGPIRIVDTNIAAQPVLSTPLKVVSPSTLSDISTSSFKFQSG